MLMLLVTVTVVSITSAGYIPPYYGHYGYGGSYGDRHGLHDTDYGGYDGKGSDHDHGYYGDKYGHHYGHVGYGESGYGDHGHSVGNRYYDKKETSGYGGESYEKGGKTVSDSDGIRKFSYFAAGSGPEGEYKKGYYGSEGYEDSKHKSKYSAGSLGRGYNKDYFDKGSAHHDDHGYFSKDLVHSSKHGGHYESGHYGQGGDDHHMGYHDDGWRNSGYGSGYGAHVSY